jgi:hypothetical protein
MVRISDARMSGTAFGASACLAGVRGRRAARAAATDVDGLPTAAERDRWLAAAGDVHR